MHRARHHKEIGTSRSMGVKTKRKYLLAILACSLALFAYPGVVMADRTGDLIKVMDTSLRPEDRLEAVEGLKRIAVEEGSKPKGDNRAIDALIAALKDNNMLVSVKAATALEVIGKPAVTKLVNALRDEDLSVRLGVCSALKNSGTYGFQTVTAALKNDNKSMRAGAAYVLGHVWPREAVKPLVLALKDNDQKVRDCAAQGLAYSKDPKAVEPLIDVLRTWGPYETSVAVALVMIGTPAVKMLEKTSTQDPDPQVRDVANRILNQIRTQGK